MIMITTLLNPVSIIKRVSGSVSRVFGWVVAVTAVVFSAFVIYFGIYILYVPAKVHIKPVHFEFNTHGYSSGFHSGVPHALVSLRDGHLHGDRILARGQQYVVSLVLHLPLSEVNKNVGMFMTTLTFLSKEKREVDKVSRSALIPYSSPIVATLSSLLDFLLLHWRWKQESEKLSIVLFEKFIDDSYHPTEYAQITVYCEDIQIYSAELRIDATFSGIRYYMFYWPLSSALFGITSNLLFGIVASLWLYFKFCKGYDGEDDASEESFEIEDIESFLHTYTDSFPTNVEDPPLAHEVESDANQLDVQDGQGEQVVQRQTVRLRRSHGRHPPLRRLVDIPVRNQPETEIRRQPCVSLTRRSKLARSTRDQACQTDSSLENRPLDRLNTE